METAPPLSGRAGQRLDHLSHIALARTDHMTGLSYQGILGNVYLAWQPCALIKALERGFYY